MILKPKLRPEVRLALIAQRKHKAARLKQIERSSITQPIIIAVVTAILGFLFGITTNFFGARFQSEASISIWNTQHTVESRDKLFSIRAELVDSFQEAISKYFDFDAETEIESNFNSLKTAVKVVMPNFDPNAFASFPIFPTVAQIKDNRENWSKLEGLAQSIEVYFGSKIGKETHDLLKMLNSEPTNELNFDLAVQQLTRMRDNKAFNMQNLQSTFKTYLSPAPHTAHLQSSLTVLGLDMKCLLRRSIDTERNLSNDPCHG